ncbi:MAG: hypothetical protein AAF915_26900 [Cyanobacteria bacterium P01_D01_bin.50]
MQNTIKEELISIYDQTIKWIQAPGFIRGKIKIFSLFQAPRFIDGVTLLTFDERKRLTFDCGNFNPSSTRSYCTIRDNSIFQNATRLY